MMEQKSYEEILQELEKQEKELIFDHFSNEDAFNLGMIIVNKAKERDLPVTIEITKNSQMIFHIALEGTAPDNDEWLRRKKNLVTRTGKSSFRIVTELRMDDAKFEDRFELTREDYAPAGGCFPINIKGTGIVGTVAVSGLEMSLDHGLVIEGIKEYLGK